MQLVDTHCHVDFQHFDEDRDAVFNRYVESGGQWLVAVAVDLENMPRLFALTDARDHVYCSVGVHPNHEPDAEPAVDQLCELAVHPKCVAIGETGMDFFRQHVDSAIHRTSLFILMVRFSHHQLGECNPQQHIHNSAHCQKLGL